MSKVIWDATGEKTYETGVRNGVLYPVVGGAYSKGVAWNGLTAVTESPSGAEATPLYADDIKYLNLISAEEFGATIEAYTSPKEFDACDGTKEIAPGVTIGQQDRQTFGMCYRTTKGNDTASNAYGYKLHIIYGALAAPSEKAYNTINDSPEAITFSWEVSTTPVNVTGFKPTASLTIDSTECDPTKLAQLEAILYGSDGTATYTEFTGTAFEVGTTYYERSGAGTSQSPYVYTPTQDTVYNSEKTYYTKSMVGATDPRLPLPDEIAGIMGESANPGNG